MVWGKVAAGIRGLLYGSVGENRLYLERRATRGNGAAASAWFAVESKGLPLEGPALVRKSRGDEI
jgi:hypothetical protein